MKILLTGTDNPIGNLIESALRDRHTITVLPPRESSTPPDTGTPARNHPRDPDRLLSALEGVQAIIHAENAVVVAPADPDEEALAFHRATTDTDHLGHAARGAGVDRIIVISSLNVFDTVDRKYRVDEMWRPRPKPDPSHLLPHLAAECVREHVRHGPLCGLCLRFAPLGDDPATETRKADAIAAVEQALALPFDPGGYRWHVIHVANSPRFIDRDARRILGLHRPQPNPS